MGRENSCFNPAPPANTSLGKFQQAGQAGQALQSVNSG